MQQELSLGIRRGTFTGGRRAPQYLTMRLVAEIESVGAMASAVRARERAGRDRECLQRRRLAVAHRFSREHARDICLDRHLDNRIAAARLRDAHAETGFGVRRSAFGVLVL